MEPPAGLVAIFEAMSDDPDVEYLIVDSTIADHLRHVIAAKGALAVIPNNPHHKASRFRKSRQTFSMRPCSNIVVLGAFLSIA